ncbi:MAG: SGNH/GDSL hydrolase family protein [Synechococcus sp.]|nr:SGNH/GDSL hydrolase family protein [Synechococcus sp.]
MALKSPWRANALALTGSLLLSLLAAELLLRLLRLGYNHAPLNPSASRHHEHPANFSFKAYSLQNEWDEFPIRTDRFGNRSLQGLCRLSTSRPQRHLLVLGDSFIEGFQVRDAESITGILQQRLCPEGIEVHNLGVSSYSPLLSQIQLREYLRAHPAAAGLLQGGTVLHVLYDNDHAGDQEYGAQLQRNASGEPVVPAAQELSPLAQLARVSYLARLLRRAQLTSAELARQGRQPPLQQPGPLAPAAECAVPEEQWHVTEAALRAIRDQVQAAGGRYVLSAIPTDPRKGPTLMPCYPLLAERLGVPYLPVAAPLLAQPQRYYFRHDIHLNPAGNRVVADQLFNGLAPQR